MTIDPTTRIDELIGALRRGYISDNEADATAQRDHAAADELRRRDAELAALRAAPTPWELLNYAQKQQREAAMQRIAGAAGHGASVTTDFPWQGRTSISGSWDIEDLRKLLAAMEGR
jgi:hypothetical protein